ncbi:MAG: thioredoxin family protein [Myxococcota bacterium]
MTAVSNESMRVGTSAPSFRLEGTDGAWWSLDDFASSSVLVVLFTCNHCPYAKAAEDRLIALQNEYAPEQLRLVAINPNDSERYPEDSFENMVVRAKERQFNFPYLIDRTQQVARSYHAVCTPDPFVFGPDRTLVYNGRIDDHWRDASKVTRTDLADAVRQALTGAPVEFETLPAVGCSIKWKPSSGPMSA